MSVCGRGGVGTVYRARDHRSGTVVALKLLAPAPVGDATAARRLAREFEALRALDHPNVVRVVEAGVCEGYSFLAMELVEGLDLRSYLSPAFDLPPAAEGRLALERDVATTPGLDSFSSFSDEPDTESLVGPLEQGGAEAIRAFAELMDEPDTDGDELQPLPDPPFLPVEHSPETTPPHVTALLNAPARMQRLRAAIAQVCAALGYVHAHGLVHRDLKPSNIMVDDERRVRLMDFGLVKLAGESTGLTLHGKVVGTYRYMSPEQARGRPVDARSDLYSLGVILFELLCGRAPFLAERPHDLWRDIIERPPRSVASLNPGADARLAAVAERLLQKDPAERFQRADDVCAFFR
jgi:serine/threonine protein kinase